MRDPRGQPWVALAQMEPGLVAHEHVDRLGVARREIFEIAAIPLQIHAGQVREMGFSADHAERAPACSRPGLVLSQRAHSRSDGWVAEL